MEERLKEILALVNEHQRFAETKNAALLAVDAAAVLGVLQVLTSDAEIHRILIAYFLCVGICGVISGLLTLISFIPQTHIPWLRLLKAPKPGDSLLFFGDVQKYNSDSFLEALCAATNTARGTPTKFERMYAEQIIVNSRITARKFFYFRCAIWTALAGLLTPIGVAVLVPVVSERHTE
jgi:hypothetical protein